MSLYMNLDDVIYDGQESIFRKLVFYSSLCAALILNIPCELIGEFRMFYPRDPTPELEAEFTREYRCAFNILIPFFENS